MEKRHISVELSVKACGSLQSVPLFKTNLVEWNSSLINVVTNESHTNFLVQFFDRSIKNLYQEK